MTTPIIRQPSEQWWTRFAMLQPWQDKDLAALLDELRHPADPRTAEQVDADEHAREWRETYQSLL